MATKSALSACITSSGVPTDAPMMNCSGVKRRTTAARRSSGPTCTPAAPTASATSTRPLTSSGIPAHGSEQASRCLGEHPRRLARQSQRDHRRASRYRRGTSACQLVDPRRAANPSPPRGATHSRRRARCARHFFVGCSRLAGVPCSRVAPQPPRAESHARRAAFTAAACAGETRS